MTHPRAHVLFVDGAVFIEDDFNGALLADARTKRLLSMSRAYR
jgi:hypothetical protein